jgi:16S rRNA (uracil1498-N3)-methyltransferase
MLQSQQCRLPVLLEPTDFGKAIQFSFGQKFIAHCEESNKPSLSSQQISNPTSQLILIGPEGDFTHEEIEAAIKNKFVPVSLGDTRLRTETAGMVAATLLCIH